MCVEAASIASAPTRGVTLEQSKADSAVPSMWQAPVSGGPESSGQCPEAVARPAATRECRAPPRRGPRPRTRGARRTRPAAQRQCRPRTAPQRCRDCSVNLVRVDGGSKYCQDEGGMVASRASAGHRCMSAASRSRARRHGPGPFGSGSGRGAAVSMGPGQGAAGSSQHALVASTARSPVQD